MFYCVDLVNDKDVQRGILTASIVVCVVISGPVVIGGPVVISDPVIVSGSVVGTRLHVPCHYLLCVMFSNPVVGTRLRIPCRDLHRIPYRAPCSVPCHVGGPIVGIGSPVDISGPGVIGGPVVSSPVVSTRL